MEEKIFTINLRRELLKTPRWKKTKRTSTIIRNFLKKHMKSDEIKIGKSITEKLWERGDQKPPNKIKIKAIKTDDNIIKAELFGTIFPEELKEEKSKEKKKEEKKEPEKKEETKEKSTNE